MGRLRYIGSKTRIRKEILDLIGKPTSLNKNFVDLFCGTGVISQEASLMGWKVKANDHLLSSSIITIAHLLSEEEITFEKFGGYINALTDLNNTPPVPGFIFNEYTPEGSSRSGHVRMYFTPINGMKIDAIRSRINEWFDIGLINIKERTLLIADLLSAANSIANIAGTYGCYLSHWDNSALRSLILTPRKLFNHRVEFQVTNKDAFQIKTDVADVIYIDPPYTKRQYAAYYHILETIAHGDAPKVDGITGLRPWKEKLSLFCYKVKALKALERLIDNINAHKIFLSYSSEGHMSLEDIDSLFSNFGETTINNVSNIGRYRPNQKASVVETVVTEYLIELTKKTAIEVVP